MKYLEFSSLLEGHPARIAFLSTFQFDPDFFERRLLRCPTLTKARKIVVFLDARQWLALLRRDVPARWLNRRYLVVPVNRTQGVFHPKLSLLLTEAGGQVLCGSNNLTRSGCSSNLELLNSISFDSAAALAEESNVAREAFAFFEQASRHTDGEITRIATDWIEETAQMFSWLREPISPSDRNVRLLHTYEGGLWDRLVKHLDGKRPKAFLIVSPFHDADGEIIYRLTKQWPRAHVELLVQQNYTNLAVKPLKKLHHIRLSEIQNSSRRIHAKLLAWRHGNGGGCLVGSANFTTTALDGYNVEACLLLSKADQLVEALFDRNLPRRPLALDDFAPGEAACPDAPETMPSLRITSALLTEANQLRVSYSHDLDFPLGSLRLTVRAPGESRPRASIGVSTNPRSMEAILLPDSVNADLHGTLLASLIGKAGGESIESPPVWIIQESRLTYEPGDGSSSSKSKIEDTGEGLPEYLDDLGKRNGLAAVVEYLQHLNIRFQGGAERESWNRRFRVNVRDPFHADIAPDWLIEAKASADDLEEAIYEFVERHERKRLHKHAGLGNLNGMENFLDILTTLVRLLYIYYKRGIVKRARLIGHVCTLIELAIVGKSTEDEQFDGYLCSVYDSLGGDFNLLREVCDETNYLAEVRGALLIVQSVRFDPNETPKYGPKAKRPRETLPTHAKAIAAAINKCHLREPKPKDVQRALENYRMFEEGEIAQLLAEHQQ